MDALKSGIILAGGANRRFGGITKANKIVDGTPIISRIISAIDELVDEMIIVTNKPDEFRDYSRCKIIKDYYLNAGPLGGIHAGLKQACNDTCFVVAGDMPYIDTNLVRDLLIRFSESDYDVLVPSSCSFTEPLHAVYSCSILDDLEKFLCEGRDRSVRNFLAVVRTGYFVIPGSDAVRHAFTNINSPGDLAKA